MSSWKGSSRGGVFGHLFFAFILKHLHISIAYFILRFVAFYFLLFTPKAFKSLYFFYHTILGRGVVKSVIGIYGNFYRFGQILLDKVSVTAGYTRNVKHSAEGFSNLKAMVEKGRGGFLICSHAGGWELAGYLLEDFGLKPKILMLEAEQAAVKSLLDRISVLNKPDIIPLKEDMSHIVKIAHALRNNEIIAIQGDRFIPGSKTIELDFLGQPARFPAGPFAIAAKFDVPISLIFANREKRREYRCVASPLFQASDTPDLQKSGDIIRHLASRYVRQLEEFTRQYPDQWFNYYDFWQKQ